MRLDAQTYRFTDPGKFGTIMLAIGLVGLVASAAGAFVDTKQFYYSYLTAFVYWVSVGLGGLFFTMIHHLVDATWSVVLRRLTESVMYTLPIMIVFFLPIAFGLGNLYKWSDATYASADHILAQKMGFLNPTFFLIRTLIYFGIWTFLALRLYKVSRQQDAGHSPEVTKKARMISAPGVILFAITTTFAAWDWIMSLDAHWYSTIFGAYYFAGSAMSLMALAIILVLVMARKGVLNHAITVEHYHDMAKMMFAFTVFWAYMAFSQYFLIWYANIPEETIWYLERWEGSWKYVSLAIVFGHFVAPFFLLITRAAKRSPGMLMFIAAWMLVIHFVDLYWLVLPNLSHHGAHFSWMDLTTMVGIGGIFLWYFWRRYTSGAAVPVNDPKLAASIKFINH